MIPSFLEVGFTAKKTYLLNQLQFFFCDDFVGLIYTCGFLLDIWIPVFSAIFTHPCCRMVNQYCISITLWGRFVSEPNFHGNLRVHPLCHPPQEIRPY